MNKQSAWLLNFKFDVYSQTGEDGITQKALATLPQTDKWCVEFGAGDGECLSNTRNLIDKQSYSAVLIESSRDAFRVLQQRFASNPKVVAINQSVGLTEGNKLDEILGAVPLPFDFDFLSIDIDGNDYHVWKSFLQYKPKLICIEFNPTIPTPVKFVQAPDGSLNQGSSLLSLVELGKEKGYELISVLSYNAFFVDSKYFPLFQIEDNSPEALRTDFAHVTYLFSGFDGTIFLRGSRRLLCHGLTIRESKCQQLPRLLRTYPGNYGKLQRALFRYYRIYRRILGSE